MSDNQKPTVAKTDDIRQDSLVERMRVALCCGAEGCILKEFGCLRNVHNTDEHIAAAAKLALEEAAKICDEMHAREDDNCREAAAAIRAVMENPDV